MTLLSPYYADFYGASPDAVRIFYFSDILHRRLRHARHFSLPPHAFTADAADAAGEVFFAAGRFSFSLLPTPPPA